MFTVSEDAKLNVDLIESAIEYNIKNKKENDKLESYYKGKHEILNRKKPLTAKNTRVVINHAKYITDINVGYLLGNPVDYQADDKVDISKIMEQYQQQVISDIDSEIAKDLSIFGKQYELTYPNENNDLRSVDVDVKSAICVYDDTVAHKKLFGMTYLIDEEETKGDNRKYKSITVYDDTYKYDCVDIKGDIVVPEEGEPHGFDGLIPLVEYKNNSEEMGDFQQVIELIDAYNLLQSDRINDKEQLVEAILVGYGLKMTPKQLAQLKQDRVVFGLPPKKDGASIEYLIKNLDETQVDILRQTIENDIHKISQTPNMSDENFAGNSSGVAIRYKLLAFEQSVKNKERFFERGLMERFALYNKYLSGVGKMTEVDIHQVKTVFKRNLPQNDLEVSQMINNLEGLVDDESLVGLLSFIEDASKSIELNRKEELRKFSKETPQFGTDEPTDDSKPSEEDEQES